MTKEFLQPTRRIDEICDIFKDPFNNRTIHITFEDENSLSFDVWNESSDPEVCIFSVTINLATGDGKITIQQGKEVT